MVVTISPSRMLIFRDTWLIPEQKSLLTFFYESGKSLSDGVSATLQTSVKPNMRRIWEGPVDLSQD